MSILITELFSGSQVKLTNLSQLKGFVSAAKDKGYYKGYHGAIKVLRAPNGTTKAFRITINA